MKALKILTGSVVTLIMAFIFFLIIASVNDYRPQPKELIASNETNKIQKDTLTAAIWNIGYAGLGSKMDFFYDGGNKMRDSEAHTRRNLDSILKILEQYRHTDFLMLQEVDVGSKRSYQLNQRRKVEQLLPAFNWYFTYNYKVNFVPVPLGNPLGEVNSGLLNGSKHIPAKVIRYRYDANYAWPTALFMLDRCFVSMAYPVGGNDTLFVVNTHNTAYDEGNIRKKQMEQLKTWLEQKSQNGNYIIIGGDWNQMPPEISADYFGQKPKSKNYTPAIIPRNFLIDNWQIVYDTNQPTNRGLDTALNKNSYKTIIDYYLVSPNIEILEVKTKNIQFKFTDHHPVFVRFTLRKN